MKKRQGWENYRERPSERKGKGGVEARLAEPEELEELDELRGSIDCEGHGSCVCEVATDERVKVTVVVVGGGGGGGALLHIIRLRLVYVARLLSMTFPP